MYESHELDIRSKENVRNNGEVFTPFAIVNQMLDLIPNEAWADKNFVSIEPTCGNGQFIVKLFEKKIEHGLTIEESLNTIIGMDISKDNIRDCHVRLFTLVADEMKKTVKPHSVEWVEQAVRYVAIVRNNIFLVKDSLKVLNDFGVGKGALATKKFVFESVTDEAPMKASERDEKIEKILEEFVVSDSKSTITPFLEV